MRLLRSRAMLLGAAASALAVACFDWSVASHAPDDGASTDAAASEDAAPRGDGAAADGAVPDGGGGCSDAGLSVGLAGTCAEIVAGAQGDAFDVIVVGDKVVWSTFGADGIGRVVRAELDGTRATELYSEATRHPLYLAARDGRVFWGDQQGVTEGAAGGNVRAVDLDGGVTDTIAQTAWGVRGIAVSPSYVYWLTWDSLVVRQNLMAAIPAPETLATGQTNVIEIRVDDQGFVYTRGGNETTQPGFVAARTVDNADMWSTNPQSTFPTGLALESDWVYWSERGSADGGVAGTIRRASRDAGMDQGKLCASGRRPALLTIDDTHVWFVEDEDAGDGDIRRVAKSGGTCELVVSGLARPHGIAVGSGFLFFTTRGDGRIWRIRLP